MNLPDTCEAIKEMTLKYPKARLKLIENKANGPAVEQSLRSKVSGIVLVEPQGGKVARANASAPLFEGGNVYLPNLPWLEDYRLELSGFPFRKFDDRVDATTQALLRLSGKGRSRLGDAMKKIKARK
jgi:predicted phage terminase large subunit-like protein